MSEPTPRSTAERLLRYVTDESAIISHIKRDFGYQMDKSELAWIRQRLPKGQPSRLRADVSPILGRADIPVVPSADPLLKALAGYHYRRSKTEVEQKHWWRLM
jgi:hypothetical protein